MRGPPTVDDQVGGLRRDLGAVHALAAQAHGLDETCRAIARRVLPDVARSGQGEGLRLLPHLQSVLQGLLDSHGGTALELEPAAHDDAALRQIEALPARRSAGPVLAHRPVGVHEVDGGAVLEERAFRRLGFGSQSASDRGGNARQVLEAAQALRGGFSDEGGERHARPHGHLVAGELRAAEDALQLHHHGLQAAIGNEQVVAAADDDEREVFLLGERQGIAEIVEVLRHDEKLRGTADPQRGVEAEGFSEPDRTGDSP